MSRQPCYTSAVPVRNALILALNSSYCVFLLYPKGWIYLVTVLSLYVFVYYLLKSLTSSNKRFSGELCLLHLSIVLVMQCSAI